MKHTSVTESFDRYKNIAIRSWRVISAKKAQDFSTVQKISTKPEEIGAGNVMCIGKTN